MKIHVFQRPFYKKSHWRLGRGARQVAASGRSKGVPLATKKSKKSKFSNRPKSSPNGSKRCQTSSKHVFERFRVVRGAQWCSTEAAGGVFGHPCGRSKGGPLATKKSKKSKISNRPKSSPNGPKRCQTSLKHGFGRFRVVTSAQGCSAGGASRDAGPQLLSPEVGLFVQLM